MTDTLFLITARGGSKGIPGKNIKSLHGKPLIQYSIELARKFVDDRFICVSTDSEEIAGVVEKAGLALPFMRPAELAGDEAGSYEVIRHAISHYENKMDLKKVVLFQPTSPFRLKKDVEACLKVYEAADCEMVVSVKATKANPYQLLYIENEDGFLEKVIKGPGVERRQDFSKVYQINGAVYVYNVSAIKQKHTRDFEKIKYFEMPEVNSVDIDEPLDWHWAEFLLEKQIVKLDYE